MVDVLTIGSSTPSIRIQLPAGTRLNSIRYLEPETGDSKRQAAYST